MGECPLADSGPSFKPSSTSRAPPGARRARRVCPHSARRAKRSTRSASFIGEAPVLLGGEHRRRSSERLVVVIVFTSPIPVAEIVLKILVRVGVKVRQAVGDSMFLALGTNGRVFDGSAKRLVAR
jgi:hypothetical protein